MKSFNNTLATLLIFVFVAGITAQTKENKYYRLVYKLERKTPEKKVKDPKYVATNKLLKKLGDMMDNLEFELIFDSNKSVFKQTDIQVSKEDEKIHKIASSGVGQDVFYYKDKKEKYVLKESFGKDYKVIFPYEQYKWIITNETKNIKGYTCYKAYAEWSEYDYKREKILNFKPVVWFTKSIPFPYGPKGLDGLPGLVLEGSFNGVLYFKLKKNPKHTDDLILETYEEEFPDIMEDRKIQFTKYVKMFADKS